MESTKFLINYLLKKWWVILLTACIFASGFAFTKSLNNSYVIKSGPVFISKMIRIDNYDVISYKYGNNAFSYNKYFKTYFMYKKFLDEMGTKLDMTKLCSNWEKMNNVDKYEWIANHLHIKNNGAGIYEVFWSNTQNEINDLNYIVNHGEGILNDYILFTEKELKYIESSVTITQLDSMALFPEDRKISRQDIIVKYGIIGFICGILVSSTILLVLGLKKME